jgi:2-C-methyl-D-erythritol 2,4-cyclodiphosphate synthase
MSGAPPPRAGTGYDIHRLAPGRRLILGGVDVPHDRGLVGHSDGDALAHAVIDALLGACALGDIGRHFPPGDPAYRGADSMALLGTAVALARRAGWRAHNLDATVVCERPRLAPFLPAMGAALASVLAIPPDHVNVKAKTNEGLDAVGRGEAVAVQAIIMIVRVASARDDDGRDRAREGESAGVPHASIDPV